MIQNFPKFKFFDGLCKSCQEGKIHWLPFPNVSEWKVKEWLKLVHIEVCWPIQTTSFGDNKYFILFIDDFSRTPQVYFMKEKTQMFEIFKEFFNGEAQ